MDACKRVDQALCVYGKIKRTRTEGGERTAAFMARMAAALGHLSVDELETIKGLYVLEMTQEEAAEATGCDPSTISRRKKRALERLALLLYPDQYLTDNMMV